MGQRHWGAVHAPGTSINEYEGVPRIIEGILGGAVFVGPVQKGKTSEVIPCLSWPDYQKKCGDLVDWSYVPHAVKGYFTESQGNGRAFILRVSDGTEAAGKLILKNMAGNTVLTFTAESAGSWAGGRAYEGSVTGVSQTGSDFTVTFSGSAPADGTLSGGYLQKGDDPANPIYKIVAQVGSVLTLDKPYGGTVTDTGLVCWKLNGDCLKIMTKQSTQDANMFDVVGYYKGKMICNYQKLTLDPTSNRFVETIINNDKTNAWFTVTSNYTGSLYDKTVRPVTEIATVTTATPATKTLILDISTLVTGLNEIESIAPEYAGGTLYHIDTTTGVTTGKWRIASSEYTYTGAGPYTKALKIVLEGTVGTSEFTAADNVLLESPIGFSGGFDGEWIANSNDLGVYLAEAFEISTSPIKDLGLIEPGFVKMCCPGYSTSASATAIAKAAVAFAEAYNYQFRYEPKQTDSYDSFHSDVYNTFGLSDFVCAHYPGWMKILDDEQIYIIPNIGDILGEEAKIATAYEGYFKAEAGIDAVLNRCLGLVVGTNYDYTMPDAVVEFLNPANINCLVKKQGNVVIWGDRSLATTTVWRWKHMREQMSHYEHVLQSTMDWLNFAVNNSQLWPVFHTYLASYFRQQFRKGAITGDSFEKAATIIVDASNNTEITMDNGDLEAAIILQFSGTVERVVIGIGRKTISEKPLA